MYQYMFCPKVLVISARWFRLWTKLLHCRIVMFWRRKTVKGGIFKRNFSELLKSWLHVHAFFNLLKLLFFCFHSVNSNILVILLISCVYSLPPGTLPSKCCPSPDWTQGSPNTNSCCFWVRDTWGLMDRSVSLELVVSTCQKFFNILKWYRNKLMDWFWFGWHLDSCWYVSLHLNWVWDSLLLDRCQGVSGTWISPSLQSMLGPATECSPRQDAQTWSSYRTASTDYSWTLNGESFDISCHWEYFILIV